MEIVGVPSPFFPGILLFRKPSQTQGKQPVFEKNDGREWKRNQPLETWDPHRNPRDQFVENFLEALAGNSAAGRKRTKACGETKDQRGGKGSLVAVPHLRVVMEGISWQIEAAGNTHTHRLTEAENKLR